MQINTGNADCAAYIEVKPEIEGTLTALFIVPGDKKYVIGAITGENESIETTEIQNPDKSNYAYVPGVVEKVDTSKTYVLYGANSTGGNTIVGVMFSYKSYEAGE